MGAIYLNEESFGGGGTIIGTSEPSSSIGEEGDIYLRACKYNQFVTSARTTNKWAEPITYNCDMSTVSEVHFRLTDSYEHKEFEDTVPLSEFDIIDGSLRLYRVSEKCYIGYDIESLDFIGAYVATGYTLTLNELGIIDTSSPDRIYQIFGNHNGAWLEYKPI